MIFDITKGSLLTWNNELIIILLFKNLIKSSRYYNNYSSSWGLIFLLLVYECLKTNILLFYESTLKCMSNTQNSPVASPLGIKLQAIMFSVLHSHLF